MTITVFQCSLQMDDHNSLLEMDQNLHASGNRLETATQRLQAAVQNLQAEVQGLQSAALGMKPVNQNQLTTTSNAGLLDYIDKLDKTRL